jgi:hypothetical protein
MNNPHKRNPFEVLRLEPATPNDQVVAQAGRLRQRATEESEITAIRQAVLALTGPAEERFVQEMLTHPRPYYRWPALEKLQAAFRRPPTPIRSQSSPCPSLDLNEFAELLRPVLAEQMDPPGLPFVEVDTREPALEIQRQNVEVRWQCLPEQFPG